MNATVDDRARELVEATSRLVAHLETETAHLAALRVAALADLAPEKERLADRYRSLVLAARREPTWIKALAPALMAELGEATRKFAAVATRHRHAVKAAIDTNERLFRAIAEAVGGKEAAATPYGRGGRPRVQRGEAPPRPISLNAKL